MGFVSEFFKRTDDKLERLLGVLEQRKQIDMVTKGFKVRLNLIKKYERILHRRRHWRKPIMSCVKCMPSFWGLLISLYLELMMKDVIWMYPISFLVASGVNVILSKWISFH